MKKKLSFAASQRRPRPLTAMRRPLSKNPLPSFGTLVAVGAGLVYLLTGRTGNHESTGAAAAGPVKTCFEEAPAAITGSRGDYRPPALARAGNLVKRGAPVLLGSAAVVAMYLVGKKKR